MASSFSQQAVGDRLRIDRTTMVTVIDNLERAGLVRRERNPDDRRAYVIKLTPQGARMQARAKKALDALMNDQYLAPLWKRSGRRWPSFSRDSSTDLSS